MDADVGIPYFPTMSHLSLFTFNHNVNPILISHHLVIENDEAPESDLAYPASAVRVMIMTYSDLTIWFRCQKTKASQFQNVSHDNEQDIGNNCLYHRKLQRNNFSLGGGYWF